MTDNSLKIPIDALSHMTKGPLPAGPTPRPAHQWSALPPISNGNLDGVGSSSYRTFSLPQTSSSGSSSSSNNNHNSYANNYNREPSFTYNNNNTNKHNGAGQLSGWDASRGATTENRNNTQKHAHAAKAPSACDSIISERVIIPSSKVLTQSKNSNKATSHTSAVKRKKSSNTNTTEKSDRSTRSADGVWRMIVGAASDSVKVGSTEKCVFVDILLNDIPTATAPAPATNSKALSSSSSGESSLGLVTTEEALPRKKEAGNTASAESRNVAQKRAHTERPPLSKSGSAPKRQKTEAGHIDAVASSLRRVEDNVLAELDSLEKAVLSMGSRRIVQTQKKDDANTEDKGRKKDSSCSLLPPPPAPPVPQDLRDLLTDFRSKNMQVLLDISKEKGSLENSEKSTLQAQKAACLVELSAAREENSKAKKELKDAEAKNRELEAKKQSLSLSDLFYKKRSELGSLEDDLKKKWNELSDLKNAVADVISEAEETYAELKTIRARVRAEERAQNSSSSSSIVQQSYSMAPQVNTGYDRTQQIQFNAAQPQFQPQQQQQQQQQPQSFLCDPPPLPPPPSQQFILPTEQQFQSPYYAQQLSQYNMQFQHQQQQHQQLPQLPQYTTQQSPQIPNYGYRPNDQPRTFS